MIPISKYFIKTKSQDGSVLKPRMSFALDLFALQCKINVGKKDRSYIFLQGKAGHCLEAIYNAVKNGLFLDRREIRLRGLSI
jgi:hypothetical protein